MPGSQLPMTRRHFLRLGIGGSVAGLAGCGGGEAESPPTTSTEEESVFSSVGVDGDFLVVEVAGSDALSTVNLIAPDGTLYGAERIQSGVRTVRFRLIELDLSQSSHYTPGEYELVAVSGGATVESESIELRPEFRIREIEHYANSQVPLSYTRLAVTVENTGTAPSWIYDVAYRNAPNPGANDEVNQYRAIPSLVAPTELEDLILHPNETQTYVGSEQPIRFEGADQFECSRSFKMSIILGTAANEQVEEQVRISLGGSAHSLGRVRGHTCSQASIERLDVKGSQDRTGV